MDEKRIATSRKGEVDKANFVRFRTLVEDEQPISNELEYLSLGFLPPNLKTWARFKHLIKELDEYRISRNFAIINVDNPEGKEFEWF